jgi:hypothetical protein
MIPMTSNRGGRFNFILDFLSSQIAWKVVNQANEEVLAAFKKFALENNDAYSAKLRENIYEQLIHRQFIRKTVKSPLKGKNLADAKATKNDLNC